MSSKDDEDPSYVIFSINVQGSNHSDSVASSLFEGYACVRYPHHCFRISAMHSFRQMAAAYTGNDN